MALRIGDRVKVTKTGAASYGKTGVVIALAGADGKLRIQLDPEIINALEASLTLEEPPTVPEPPRPTPTSYRGFADSPPPAGWRPFSSSSPWNTPIGSAPLHPRSAEIVANILKQAAANGGRPSNVVAGLSSLSRSPRPSGSPQDFAHPIYFARTTDPLVTLKATSNGTNITAGTRIRVPAEAVPANGADGHLCVVQPDGQMFDGWRVKAPANGMLEFAIGKLVHIEGDGLKSAATASHFALPAGVIRAQELIEGSINHALFIVIGRGSTGTDFGFGVRRDPQGGAYVYPADDADAQISGSDQPPMGARLALAYSDAEIDALPVPRWKKSILRALAHYGGYMGDTGGSGFGFQFESGAAYTAAGKPDPFVEFAKAQKLPAGSGSWAGTFTYDLGSGIDWTRLLVVTPPAIA